MSDETPGAPALLQDYVSLHNRGVRDGAFDALADLFAEDAVLTFTGIPVGPFRGRAAIRRAFQERPPSDELVLLRVDGLAGEAAAPYAWSRSPDLREGTLRLKARKGRIVALEVVRAA